MKDRIARSMVLAAEADGSLPPGQMIIESSSGNTGIGLALVSRARGYQLKIVLPENVSPERRQLLEIYGAEIIPSPGGEGSNGAIKVAQKLAADNDDWWYPYQYANPANVAAHYDGHRPRDLARLFPRSRTSSPASARAARCWASVGYLKEQNPAVQVWAVEPPTGEMVDGLKNLDEGYIPPIFIDYGGVDLLNRKKIVGPKDSIVGVRELRDVGVLVRFVDGRGLHGRQEVRGGDRGRRRGVPFARWCLEVPLEWRLDRRARRGHRARQKDALLLSAVATRHVATF